MRDLETPDSIGGYQASHSVLGPVLRIRCDIKTMSKHFVHRAGVQWSAAVAESAGPVKEGHCRVCGGSDEWEGHLSAPRSVSVFPTFDRHVETTTSPNLSLSFIRLEGR